MIDGGKLGSVLKWYLLFDNGGDGMDIKGWLQSKTIWIGAVFEVAATVIAFVEPIAALLPAEWNAQVLAAVVIVQAVIFQVVRFFTKLGVDIKVPVVK